MTKCDDVVSCLFLKSDLVFDEDEKIFERVDLGKEFDSLSPTILLPLCRPRNDDKQEQAEAQNPDDERSCNCCSHMDTFQI